MKKSKTLIIVVLVVSALAVLGVGVAFAQKPARALWNNLGHIGMMSGQGGMMGNGGGMMGGAGRMGDPALMEQMHEWMAKNGGMHNVIWGALAESLRLTWEELEAGLADGKTIAQLAKERGITLVELAERLEAAHRQALEKAVDDGILTQEQADEILNHMAGNYEWMLTHMGSHMGSGMGPGAGGCHGDTPSDNNSTSTQG